LPKINNQPLGEKTKFLLKLVSKVLVGEVWRVVLGQEVEDIAPGADFTKPFWPKSTTVKLFYKLFIHSDYSFVSPF
jgi:hypothetical protein